MTSLRRIFDHIFLKLICTLLLICAVGCSTARPVPNVVSTPISTPLLVQGIGDLPTRPPLPPSWTPEDTLTPQPTYTTTPTSTPVPTLSASALCTTFGIASTPAEGAQLAYDAKATFAWYGVPANVALVLTITLHGQKNGTRIDSNTPGDTILPFPLLDLPDAGQYDWKIWIQHPQYGEVCVHSGTFIRKPLVIM